MTGDENNWTFSRGFGNPCKAALVNDDAVINAVEDKCDANVDETEHVNVVFGGYFVDILSRLPFDMVGGFTGFLLPSYDTRILLARRVVIS